MGNSATKRIAKNFSWLFLGNLISGGCNFFTVVYIARVFGAAAFGLFQFAQAFLIYLVMLVDAGLSIFGTREVARQKDKAGPIAVNIFALRIMIAIGIFFISGTAIYLLPISAQVRLLFIFTFLFVFYRALNADWLFQGLEKMEYIAAAKVLYSAFSFVCIIGLVKSAGDILKAPLAQAVTGLVISLLFLLIVSKYFVSLNLNYINKSDWREYFWASIPLGASFILVQIYNNLDTIMLGFMDRPEVVGYYNAAYRVFYAFAALFSLWQATALPVATKRMHENKEEAVIFLSKFMRLTLLIFIPLAVLAFLASPIIIRVVFGSQYGPGIPALRILIWTLLPFAVGSTYGTLVLIPSGSFNRFFLAVMAGALVNVIFNFILIPSFSSVGAAAATVLAETFAGAVAYYYSREALRLGFLKHAFKPAIIAGLSSMLFLTACQIFFFMPELYRMSLACISFIILSLVLAILLERKFIFGFVSEIIK